MTARGVGAIMSPIRAFRFAGSRHDRRFQREIFTWKNVSSEVI